MTSWYLDHTKRLAAGLSDLFPGSGNCIIPSPQKNKSEVWGGLIRLLITL